MKLSGCTGDQENKATSLSRSSRNEPPGKLERQRRLPRSRFTAEQCFVLFLHKRRVSISKHKPWRREVWTLVFETTEHPTGNCHRSHSNKASVCNVYEKCNGTTRRGRQPRAKSGILLSPHGLDSARAARTPVVGYHSIHSG